MKPEPQQQKPFAQRMLSLIRSISAVLSCAVAMVPIFHHNQVGLYTAVREAVYRGKYVFFGIFFLAEDLWRGR
jgi:hypothetical protein